MKAFILQLENDKWFIHVSNNDYNIDNIKYESTCLFDFVKKNPPIRIYEIINITNKYEINNIVKTYMEYFGIDNVRGGIYSDEVLPRYLIEGLELEISSSLEKYQQKTAIFDSIRNKENISMEDFQSVKNEYINLLNHGYMDITRDFFTELEWLRTFVDTFTPSVEKTKGVKSISSDNIDRYNNLLKKFATIKEKYFQLSDNVKHIDQPASFNKPNFVFDFFMYHKSWKDRNWEEDKKNALELIEHYELMGYKLINIIDCLEFDFFNPVLH